MAKNVTQAKPGGGHGRIDVHVRAMTPANGAVPLVHAKLNLYKLTQGEVDALRASKRIEGQKAAVDANPAWMLVAHTHTGPAGDAQFAGLENGFYIVLYMNVSPFDKNMVRGRLIGISDGDMRGECAYQLDTRFRLETEFYANGEKLSRLHGLVGDHAWVTVKHDANETNPMPEMYYVPEAPLQSQGKDGVESSARLNSVGTTEVAVNVYMRAYDDAGAIDPDDAAHYRNARQVIVDEPSPLQVAGKITTQASRTEAEWRPVIAHWTLIRNSAEALSFNNYQLFVDHLFCHNAGGVVPDFERERFHDKERAFRSLEKRRALPFNDSDSYRVLKAATEAFVMVNCGVLRTPYAFRGQDDAEYLDRRDLPDDRKLEEELVKRYLSSLDPKTKILPYLALIRSKLPDVRIHMGHQEEHEAELCAGFIRERLVNPCMMELIWAYWQEEGMLVQTMNAITRRFQNVRALGHGSGPDPLANMEIDMLRPLNNLLWGYVQDEQHRLSVVRRNYEYDHHYGIHLDGKAVRDFRPADSRSKFIEAFHNLLRQLMPFYRQDDDTTVKADAFPILNALKEVHLILSQGAHNQFGDLPSTARIEMLMQQWMLARPEFREFLPTRLMVAHPEPWMDRVDAMKKVQGWSDTSIAHFRDLAMFGEQLLLSVRYSHWSEVYDPTEAFAWARFWRPQAQGYLHAYRAVTGVDLTAETANPKLEATMPSVLLRQRLEAMPRTA
ncbi:hypothetical protein [Massilia eburnea]|uniref:hypothetical protein n=1 Tax=Massilia eburnea TaxID=1776165 RepID=UPI003D6B786E